MVATLLVAALAMVPPACIADTGGQLGGLILVVYPDQAKVDIGSNQTVPFTVYVQEQVSLNNTTIYWSVDGDLSGAHTNLQVLNFVGAEHPVGHHSVRVVLLYGNGTDYYEWDVNVTGAVRTFTITGTNPASTMLQMEEGASLPLTISVGDPDKQVTGYRWSVDGMRQVGASGKLFNYVTGLDDGGGHEVKVEVVGRVTGSTDDIVLDHIWHVDVAEKLVCSPSNDTVEAAEAGRVDFLVGDPSFGPGGVEWRLDGNVVSLGARYVYYPGYNGSGSHQVTVITPVGTRTWDVLVSNAPRSPVVRAVPYIESKAGRTVLLQLNVSDPDGTVGLYEWDVDGDGVVDRSGGTMSSIEVKYGKAGDKVVTATVRDSTGKVQTFVTLVHVRPLVVDMTPYYLMGALACVMVILVATWGALAYRRRKRAEREAVLRAEEARKDALRKKAMQVLKADEAADADGTTSFVELPELEEKGGEGEADVEDWEVEKADRGEGAEEFEGLRDGEPDTLLMKPYASRLKDRGMGGEVKGGEEEGEGTDVSQKGTWTAEIRRAKAARDKKDKRAAYKRELDDIVSTLAMGKQAKKGAEGGRGGGGAGSGDIAGPDAHEGGARKGHAKAAETEVEAPESGDISMTQGRAGHRHGKMVRKKEREKGSGGKTGTVAGGEKARPSMKRKDSDAIIERREEEERKRRRRGGGERDRDGTGSED